MQGIKMLSPKAIRFFILCMAALGFMAGNLPVNAAEKQVRLSVRPLDLTRPPTSEDLMAAGQLGGELNPTHALRNAREQAKVNLAFGKAIQTWNNHDYDRAAEMFSEHVKEYPESPWVSEAVLHMGCYAYYHARYADAEDAFNWIVENNRGSNDLGAAALVNKAKLRLGVLRVAQGRFNEAQEIFRDLNEQGHDWRHRTYASHWIQRLARYKANRLALLNCGTKALAYLLEKRGDETGAREVENIKPIDLRGTSMEALADLAARCGHELVALQLPVPDVSGLSPPAILYVSRGQEREYGHFLVLDKTGDGFWEILDPQSGEHFQVTPDQFAREWNGIALVFSDGKALPGSRLSRLQMEELFGGCCGQPRPPDQTGDPGRNAGPNEPNDDPCSGSKGAPRWSVNMINMNLYIADTPLWYDNPIGPSVSVKVSYNSQSSITRHEPFGNKWQFNYSSYLTVDPSRNVTVFMPDGKVDVYVPNASGVYRRPYGVYNKLTRIAENHFQLRFPDDTVYVYGIPAGTGAQQPFLVEIRDVHGQKLAMRYNANVQLTSITDALGRVTSLTYNAEGRVGRVTDPFGRLASFDYDEAGNLIQITDMGGYWSKLSYDDNVYLTGLENARGKWKFYIEPADKVEDSYTDAYPPPGKHTWESYRVTVTNPMQGKSEYFYWGGGYEGSWYVSPRNYVPYVSQAINNLTKAEKTEYHLRRVGEYGEELEAGENGENGEISEIILPGGGSTKYGYDARGNRTSVQDAHGHVTQYTYNSMGRATSRTDAKGVVTEFVYASNGVDLLQIKNGLGSIVRTYNDAHEVTSVKDREGHPPWTFTYNAYGQIKTATDPQSIPTEFVYNARHQLTQIRRDGKTLSTFAYDAVGRVARYTDPTGLTLNYQYDNLDHVIKVTYPDGKHVAYTYAGCCPHLVERVTDRAGRSTQFTHDALQRLTRVDDPAGVVANYLYDANGNLAMLVDPNGNCTTFSYDANDRLDKKTYADGKSLEFEYDNAGLLKSRVNGRGISTTYTYDEVHHLMARSYTDDTPGVTYTYDDYGRMEHRHDATGDYVFTYDNDSRLTSVDGPWPNDTVTYQYDELGRRKSLVVEDGQSVVYKYDTFNRLEEILAGTNSYKYVFAGVNPLVQALTRPNGSKTMYKYDTLNRLKLISHRDSSEQIIQEYGYEYNDRDLRSGETRVDGDPVLSLKNEFTQYEHNELNQLSQSTIPERVFEYDDDGNMTQGYTPKGYQFHATYDAMNRLKTLQFIDVVAGNALRLNTYAYSGDGKLAEVEHFENGTLVDQNRYLRSGFFTLQERDQSNAVLREYIWGRHMGGGIGGLLQLTQNGADYHYLHNGRGDVTALLDNSLAAAAAYSYDAYGNPLAKIGTFDQPFRFSTKAHDEHTGLSYFGYRFFSSALGRWITRDPIAEAGGVNLYAYVGNNPVNFLDPYGLKCEDPNDSNPDGDTPDPEEPQEEDPDPPLPDDAVSDVSGAAGDALLGVGLGLDGLPPIFGWVGMGWGAWDLFWDTVESRSKPWKPSQDAWDSRKDRQGTPCIFPDCSNDGNLDHQGEP